MKRNLIRFIIVITLCTSVYAGWFNHKPKPGDTPKPVIEVVDSDLRSYFLKEDTTLKTDKGDVFFKKKEFYIVTKRFISDHTKNQDKLIKYLLKYKKQTDSITMYKIISVSSIVISCILILFICVILKDRHVR